jgi:hypothetical protein
MSPKLNNDLVFALMNIVDSWESRSELYTNDADCAANLADHARHALKKIEGDNHVPELRKEG